MEPRDPVRTRDRALLDDVLTRLAAGQISLAEARRLLGAPEALPPRTERP